MRADRVVRPYGSFKIFRDVRRGRCPHRPKGTAGFAEDFRKIGTVCRDDVGIVPYGFKTLSSC